MKAVKPFAELFSNNFWAGKKERFFRSGKEDHHAILENLWSTLIFGELLIFKAARGGLKMACRALN
ncbi:MAG: hypothetical protein AB3N63_08080 [Puniceicoccaceae bacterium]